MPAARTYGLDERGRARRRYDLHHFQDQAYRSVKRYLALAAGRRWGKTVVAAMRFAKQVQQARLQRGGGVAWVVSPIAKHTRTAWRSLKRVTPAGWITRVYGTEMYPGAMYFGDVVVEFRTAQNPDNLVAEGLCALWVDECGLIKEGVWHRQLRPTLVDLAAPATLTGTPRGANWFYELYSTALRQPNSTFGSQCLALSTQVSGAAIRGRPSWENPFVPVTEIRDLAEGMTEREYLQEILAEFLSAGGTVFGDVRRRNVQGGYSTEQTVALGCDLGRYQDFTVLIGLDARFRVTYFERWKSLRWPKQKQKILEAWERLGRPVIVMDTTHGSYGDPVADDLQAQGVWIEPFEFTAASKPALISSLQIGLEEALIVLPDEPELINELEIFDATRLPSGRIVYGAPAGKHDDCVAALGLAYRGAARFGDLGVSLGKYRSEREAEEAAKRQQAR